MSTVRVAWLLLDTGSGVEAVKMFALATTWPFEPLAVTQTLLDHGCHQPLLIRRILPLPPGAGGASLSQDGDSASWFERTTLASLIAS